MSTLQPKIKIILKSNTGETALLISQIRPSDNELIKKLKEKVDQRKHTSLPLNIRLKLIKKPKFQPQIFGLKDIECNSAKPCNNDQCRRCYNLSFANAPSNITENWSAENLLRPRDVTLTDWHEYWFDCPNKNCGHRFLKSPKEILRPPGDKKGNKNKNKDKKEVKLELKCPGPKCGHQALCDDDCHDCKISSFAISNIVNKWSNHSVAGIRLNGEWNPRNVYKNGTFRAWFNCDKCCHVVKICLNDINHIGSSLPCGYCDSKKFCETNDCDRCHQKSVASHQMAQYWLDRNELRPHQVSLNSNIKFWFKCHKCTHEFKAAPNMISCNNTWCPICRNKTELKLYNWLKLEFGDIFDKNKSVEWCRSKETGCYLPFDFLFHCFKLIIELDGSGHFKQIMNWENPEKRQNTDIYKMNCALEIKYSVIRILQEDVYHDRNNWQDKLKPLIKTYDTPTIMYIKNGNHYIPYEKKWQKLSQNAN